MGTASAPPSPRVKYAPDHRLKLISMSPLIKQFPATSKSLPPPSPPGLSPRTLNSANLKPFFSGNESTASSASNISLLEKIAEAKRSFDVQPALPAMETKKTSSFVQTNPFLPIVGDPSNDFLNGKYIYIDEKFVSNQFNWMDYSLFLRLQKPLGSSTRRNPQKRYTKLNRGSRAIKRYRRRRSPWTTRKPMVPKTRRL